MISPLLDDKFKPYKLDPDDNTKFIYVDPNDAIFLGLATEYKELEQAPPAPGNARGQHDAMIKQGLCQKACLNPKKNRYCNLFPFDEHIVELEDPNQYINASWVTLLPWHPYRRYNEYILQIMKFFYRYVHNI